MQFNSKSPDMLTSAFSSNPLKHEITVISTRSNPPPTPPPSRSHGLLFKYCMAFLCLEYAPEGFMQVITLLVIFFIIFFITIE